MRQSRTLKTWWKVKKDQSNCTFSHFTCRCLEENNFLQAFYSEFDRRGYSFSLLGFILLLFYLGYRGKVPVYLAFVSFCCLLVMNILRLAKATFVTMPFSDTFCRSKPTSKIVALPDTNRFVMNFHQICLLA